MITCYDSNIINIYIKNDLSFFSDSSNKLWSDNKISVTIGDKSTESG